MTKDSQKLKRIRLRRERMWKLVDADTNELVEEIVTALRRRRAVKPVIVHQPHEEIWN